MVNTIKTYFDMTDCQKIGRSLRKLFYTHDYKLHNVFMYQWECDFWCLSSAGYAKEVEIKISRSDFKADFKKEQKHILLSTSRGSPNKFYYACPQLLLKVEEIPAYAGLIYWDEVFGCKIIKEAPYIHKAKDSYTARLLGKYYGKYLSAMNKLLDFRSSFQYGLSDEKKNELNVFISKFHFD